MKLGLVALMATVLLSSQTLHAQENSECDTRTDRYMAIFRTGTEKDGLTLCAEYSDFDEAVVNSPLLKRLFAVRTSGGKEQVIKTMMPTSKDSSFGFWAGPY